MENIKEYPVYLVKGKCEACRKSCSRKECSMKNNELEENEPMNKVKIEVYDESKKYDELQKILFAVEEVMRNTALLDNIQSEEELDSVMPELLASLGKYAQADRSYIFELKPGTTDVLYMAHVWCAEGVLPTIREMEDLPLSGVPNWFSILNNDGVIVSWDWESDREKWPEEFELFSGQGIDSIIIIPVVSGGVVTGYMGVDNPASSRIELAVRFMRGISGHIGGLKNNLQMMKELEENRNSLQKSLEALNNEKIILDALSVDYTSIYYCDLMNDTLIPIKCDDYNNAAAVVKEMAEEKGSYSFIIKHYFEHFVIKESAPDFLEKMDAEYLKEHLNRNKRFAYKYRVKPNKVGQQYFEVQIVRLEDETGFKVIMGYRYIDDIVAEQEKLQTNLENALAEANLNSEIIGSISKIYWLIYRIDLVEKTYEEISASQETHKLTGKTGYIADIFEEMCDKIVSDEHKQMMREFWNVSTLSERLKDTESVAVEYRTRAGTWNQARIIAKKRDDEGKTLNALYVVRKIDREKKKEIEYKQKLMETAEEARRANMAKTDFLRRMSHDIRTPINGIRGMISIAEHFSDDMKKQAECREKVKEASGFLLDLVNNILDMNKLESGAIVLERKPFNLLDVLQEINNIAEMNAGLRGLKVYIDHKNIEHSHLIGSPVHLKQILQNIEGNAVKYNRDGGSVSFSASETACANGVATYKFVCSDTGRGMSKEFISHAFEPFAQEDSNARTAYMGTGLGLPIAKQLAEMMGGTIEVESELNVGTTFTTTISFALDTDYEKENTSLKSVAEGDVSGVKVLLVEDNELNTEIAKFILENAGMDVMTAFNGKEAVDRFTSSEEGQFDLILMDVMMPVMDGLSAARAIRAMKRKDAQEIPIFAMTANAFSDDIAESRRAGMNEHLSKPLDEAEMMRAIKRYVLR